MRQANSDDFDPRLRLKKSKADERRQLSEDEPIEPTPNQFWTQPHGVRLIFIEGDVVNRIGATVRNRGLDVKCQKTNQMRAYPAHVGTLLSRRRRGAWSVAVATWFSAGWTKVQETTGGTICTDVEQLSTIALALKRRVIALSYDHTEEAAGLIEIAPDGLVAKQTYVTTVLQTPRNPNHHPQVVNDPNATGLAAALQGAGIDVAAHLAGPQEMTTIVNTYG